MADFVPHYLLLFLLGFLLTLAEPRCNGVLKTLSGVITSPNYPKNYPNNMNCHWRISPEKSHVNLSIEFFKLEDSQTCNAFDFVKIKARVGYASREGSLCGFQAPRQSSLKVDGRPIEVTFKSDSSFTANGFKISYRAYDVDPCVTNNGGCSHNCSLVRGDRVCPCPKGYALKFDRKTCADKNSCYFVGDKKCPYRKSLTCKNLANGTAYCVCRRGFTEKDGECQDIDECKEEPDRCGPGRCKNYKGWFSCQCNSGYRQDYTKNTCVDQNECYHHDVDCGNATCVNSPGSYKCQCSPGYQFYNKLRKCQDINECTTVNNTCDHMCTNTQGSFKCSCRPGYFLDKDGKSCRDINECNDIDAADCGTATCVNTPGSFKCQCPPGYKFDDELRACQDINECVTNSIACDHMCTNIQGSYLCSCRAGYSLDEDGKSCQEVPLSPRRQVDDP